jgi:glucokinase
MKYIIGIDIGGTKINTILMNEKAKIVRKIKVPTPKNKNLIIKKIIDDINFVSSGINKNFILGVGVGVPGCLSKEKTRILKLPNLPCFNKIDLKRIIEKKSKLKVLIENDTNCMALGEFLFGYGKGKNIKNLVCLSIGTGVGGGIIINKRIYHGKENAGEVGHITIEVNGIKCNCGSYGCLEEYVSVRGIKRIAKALKLKEKNIIKIQEAAKKGDKKAQEVYKTAGKYLGIGLSNIVKVLDPELILIGGGISKSGDLLLKPAIEEMKKRTFFKTRDVKTVKLGDDSGAVGAASLFL